MSSTDVETLRAFYVGSRQQLYTYAISITSNRESAEDAIHDVFQRLLRLERLPAELRPYVFRSVRNAALDTLRRTKARSDSVFESNPAVDAADPREPAPFKAGELEQWLHLLSLDERETIVLKIYDEFTFQQIADLRQVPLPTVASWYRRGLDKLKTIIPTGLL